MSSHSRCCCTEFREQNKELKGALCTQRQQISELHLQVSSLQREVVIANASYQRLLALPSHNSLTRPLSFQPFFRILKFARAANSHLPTYRREHYIGQFYWTEESFEKERLGVSGMTVLRDEHSGPLSFLVGEEGVVVSTRRQQQFFRFGRILYNTLLRYDMAPGDWHDIDVYALEWFCLVIRVKYAEFRLCDDNWKAEAFGAVHYTEWCRPTTAAHRNSFSESETVRARDARENETHAPSPAKDARVSPRFLDSNLEVRKRKEVAVQVTRPLDFDTATIVGDAPASAVSDVWARNTDIIRDFPSVHEDNEGLNDFMGLSTSPPSANSRFAFTVCSVNQSHVGRVHAEDPPDFLELKAQEQSRVASASKLVEEKRRQFNVLKKDIAYKAKPRGKEKKQWHVQTRRAYDDIISSCLDDFNRDKAKQNNGTVLTSPPLPVHPVEQGHRTVKRKVTARRHQAGRRFQQATSSDVKVNEQDEPKAWEQRSDVQQRLAGLVQYVDHVERAYRMEERVLLSRQFSEESAASQAESSRKSDPREQPVEEAHARKLRLSRMLPDFDSYHAIVMGQRVKEFRKKKAEAARKVQEEKSARVQEQREREARERLAHMEAVLRQRRAAKSSDAQKQPSGKQLEVERKLEREPGTAASNIIVERAPRVQSVASKLRPGVSVKPRVQQKWDRTSVADLQPISMEERYETGGSGHKSSEGVMETTSKSRLGLVSGQPKLTMPIKSVEQTDTQTEARMSSAQQKWERTSAANLQPISVDERYQAGNTSHKSSEVALETAPKYRPGMFAGRLKPTVPVQPAEQSGTQAEARTKAQTEFQARMKARLEAQANAAAKRRRELENPVVLEDARRKGLRTKTEPSTTPSNLAVKNEIPGRTDIPLTVSGSLGPRRVSGVYSPSAPLPTSDPVAHKRVSGWRSSTTMPRGGTLARQGTENLTRDPSMEKSPRGPLATASPRVGTQMPTDKSVGNSSSFTWQPVTDDPRTDLFPPTTKTRGRGFVVNSPVPKPTAVKDTPEAAFGQESRFTPAKRLVPSHEVWRPGKVAVRD
ncbi:hypothetical protein EDD15DRAFT_2228316 [Pisolithus albus]|nr:hypothetical protein EDD15DRAFT_2228316 [Pisolithus albus]